MASVSKSGPDVDGAVDARDDRLCDAAGSELQRRFVGQDRRDVAADREVDVFARTRRRQRRGRAVAPDDGDDVARDRRSAQILGVVVDLHDHRVGGARRRRADADGPPEHQLRTPVQPRDHRDLGAQTLDQPRHRGQPYRQVAQPPGAHDGRERIAGEEGAAREVAPLEPGARFRHPAEEDVGPVEPGEGRDLGRRDVRGVYAVGVDDERASAHWPFHWPFDWRSVRGHCGRPPTPWPKVLSTTLPLPTCHFSRQAGPEERWCNDAVGPDRGPSGARGRGPRVRAGSQGPRRGPGPPRRQARRGRRRGPALLVRGRRPRVARPPRSGGARWPGLRPRRAGRRGRGARARRGARPVPPDGRRGRDDPRSGNPGPARARSCPAWSTAHTSPRSPSPRVPYSAAAPPTSSCCPCRPPTRPPTRPQPAATSGSSTAPR